MPAPAALARALEALDRALHTPQLRADRQQLDALLAPDFSEIGSSGRCWSRADTLRDLPAATEPVSLEACDFTVWQLADDLAQVRYRSRYHREGAQRWVLRSSLWRQAQGRWQMVFHQGTPAA
ncbi:MAG: hypothetical protein GAK31_02776 [Stenotrophomonas maltophilia]|uniref:DUF4440 domain-containing protein n=1 Tax=Stenotrophomonas maltophilia TaxID=40324 RepID=A0A7V8JKC3_STEMA|nr:MAG: hypothetical protein GAK31_02776 [Stenotrophomonas maltophilia]